MRPFLLLSGLALLSIVVVIGLVLVLPGIAWPGRRPGGSTMGRC